MIKRIKYMTSRHEVLDFAYLAAFFIGLIQISEVTKAIIHNHSTASVQLLGLQMLAMAACGMIAYVYHIKNKLDIELIVIMPIIAGYITLSIGSLWEQAIKEVSEPFFVNLNGISFVISAWMITELVKRFYRIQVYRRREMKVTGQVRISKNHRGAIDTPTSIKVIRSKVEEIANEIKDDLRE